MTDTPMTDASFFEGMTMTDTPMTDASFFMDQTVTVRDCEHMEKTFRWVPIDFARYLERRLAAATARAEAAEGVIDIGIKLRQELTDENHAIRAALEGVRKALLQIAVLAEYGTTGPGKCDSRNLTAVQATSLRLSISNIARAALPSADQGSGKS